MVIVATLCRDHVDYPKDSATLYELINRFPRRYQELFTTRESAYGEYVTFAMFPSGIATGVAEMKERETEARVRAAFVKRLESFGAACQWKEIRYE